MQFGIFSSEMYSSSACCLHSHFSLKAMRPHTILWNEHRFVSGLGGTNAELFGQKVGRLGTTLNSEWSFMGGSRLVINPRVGSPAPNKKDSVVCASWFTSAHIASNVFTVGTAAVLPFYTLMVLAPKAALTKRAMVSGIPYVVFGLLYGYLLCLSWTPDTLHLMFASKYMLPELSGMAKMFSSEMTLASAWIHLLAVDLFAARQVYLDGLENDIETRHSVSFCLLFCPLGILTHVITKILVKGTGDTGQSI